MKRFIITAMTVFITLYSSAQQLTDLIANSYKGTLTATIDGNKYGDQGEWELKVLKDNGQVTLRMESVVINEYGMDAYIGTVEISGIALNALDPDAVNINAVQTIKIKSGEYDAGGNLAKSAKENPSVCNTSTGEDQPCDDGWMGPYLGELPVILSGTASPNGIDLTLNLHVQGSSTHSINSEYYNAVMTFKAGDVPTAIYHVAESSRPAVAYTLDGRRAASGAKGIVIIDGKKVVK